MPTTSRGAPYPGDGPAVPNDVPGDIRRLAEWVNARPGVTPMTSTSRAALTGAELWRGRTVHETDTDRLVVYTSTGWVTYSPDQGTAGAWVTYTPTVTGAVVFAVNRARLHRVGRTVHVKGTVGVLFVSSEWTVALPLPATAQAAAELLGTALMTGTNGLLPARGTTTALTFTRPSNDWVGHVQYDLCYETE